MHRNNFPSDGHFFLSSTLKRWFSVHKRSLPWRNRPTPYMVWISEVMLQQTRANVVIPYFERWMQEFPTILSVAQASLEKVMKAWEGLGYYSRVRNLHEAAKRIVQMHEGEVPAARDSLQKIKGLGRYTIGALLSFAFHQKAAAVDANALRVLVRYFAITGDVSKSSVQKEIWALAEAMLPDDEPWIVVEALIELGATLCMQEPKCYRCPLHSHCRAFHQGNAATLPLKKRKNSIQMLRRHVIVIQSQDSFLLKQGEKGKVMADLYEFLYCEESMTIEKFLQGLPFPCTLERFLEEQKHSFTRFRVTLLPSLWKTEQPMPVEGCRWVSKREIHALPFSSGHKKVVQSLL